MTNFLLPSSTSSLRATKFSATRRPTSCGEVPAGQLRKYDWPLSGPAADRTTPNANNVMNFLFGRFKIGPPGYRFVLSAVAGAMTRRALAQKSITIVTKFRVDWCDFVDRSCSFGKT